MAPAATGAKKQKKKWSKGKGKANLCHFLCPMHDRPNGCAMDNSKT